MKFFKKSISTLLSILIALNFTFCRAEEIKSSGHAEGEIEASECTSEEIEPSENTNDNKSSILKYAIAGGAATVATAAAVTAGIVATRNKKYPGIKAIHWRDSLCWWIGSMLYLYYYTDFKNFVCNPKHYDLQNNFIGVKNENLNKVLLDLREIFGMLDECDGVCQITNDKEKMNQYLNNLIALRDSLRNNFQVPNNGQNLKDKQYHSPVARMIMDAVNKDARFVCGDLDAKYDRVYNDDNGNKVTEHYKVKLMGDPTMRGYHCYVYLEPIDDSGNKMEGKAGFSLGRSFPYRDFQAIKNEILNTQQNFSDYNLYNMWHSC